MAGLEHSRWLVWYSNIFGLMPIRMEVDAKTGKFQKLYCSWGHPATWWFILLFIFRVAMEFWIICNSESVFNEVNTEQSLPTKFTFILQFVTAIITLLTPLLILGFHKNLAKAWEYLKRFDSNIKPTRKWTCTSKRRIVCGVFLALLVVSQINVQIFLSIKCIHKFDFALEHRFPSCGRHNIRSFLFRRWYTIFLLYGRLHYRDIQPKLRTFTLRSLGLLRYRSSSESPHVTPSSSEVQCTLQCCCADRRKFLELSVIITFNFINQKL